MTVLLLLLKLLLWLVLGILGLLLLLLLIILLVPICYSFEGAKYSQLSMKAKVAWLFGLLRVQYSIEDGSKSLAVKLLWKDMLKKKPKKAKAKKTTLKKTKTKKAKPAEDKPLTPAEAKKPAEPEAPAPALKSSTEKAPAEKKSARRREKAGSAESVDEAGKPLDKAKDALAFLRSPEQEGTLKLIFSRLFKMLKSILPRKFCGRLRFGLEDPYTTGLLAGGASMFYPVYKDTLELAAVFDEEVVEGEGELHGRIIIGVIAYHGLRLYMDKRIRRMIKHFKP